MSDLLLHIDLESRSTVDLRKTGVYVYAEDPTTELWCACYALGDGPIEVWRPGEPCPQVIADHVLSGGVFVGHNSNFEMTLWHYILAPRHGWPEPSIKQWRCTMTQAYAMALPGALDDAAAAVGLPQRKDAAGGRLMQQMSRPRKKDPLTWWDQPEKIERLVAYCRQDIEVERELGKRLRPLKQSELDLWHLDQVVNRTGVYVDVPLCNAAKKIVATTADRLDAAMHAVTDGAVGACSNVGQLIAWVRTFGVETESIAKDVLEELLARDLPAPVRAALELRREAAKASVAKIEALLRGKSADGRARGLLQFHAASTGRWGGRRFQPQNVVRPDEDFPIDVAIAALLEGWSDTLFEDGIHLVSQCLRGMVAAAPGKKIVAADYVGIEGVVLPWLAGEAWKLDAIRAFQRGEGPDMYKVAYGRAFGVDPNTVKKGSTERQIGKVMELALGYQGGVGAFQTMAVNYGVRLPDDEVEVIRDGWRAIHPAIKAFWWDLEKAAIEAVENPGLTTAVRDIRFKVAGSFLFMRLPSGRFLAYAYPEILPKVMPWKDDRGNDVVKESLSYMGVNSYTRKWERCFAYGGQLANNATQATARDIMGDAMPRLEVAGYPIILTVHDEIVAEVPEDFGSVEEMISIMTTLPAWAAGCPITAEGWAGPRYRK